MTSDSRFRFWRIATVCVALILVGVIISAKIRERTLVREHEVTRGEWEKHVRGLSALNDEKDQMIERIFDSQDEFDRELREARTENAKLKEELASLRAAKRPAAESGL